MERPKHQYRLAIVLVMALHLFGLLGMKLPWMNELIQVYSPFESFAALTPLNLMLTLGILLLFHREWNKASVFFFLTAFVLGFLVEWIGVHTQLIFGNYWYGATLGWKIQGIPVLIGVNWLVLIYCTSSVLTKLDVSIYLKSLLGAVMMVILDVLIEPVAIAFDFWSWQGGEIPLSNYIGWFFVAFALSFLYHRLSFSKMNKMARPILLAQFLFFLLHNLLFFGE